MPPSQKRRKVKDSSPTKLNPTLYLGYVDDSESVEEIMRKFQILDEIEQNKKKEMSMNGESTQQDNVELSDKDLEEIFHKTSSLVFEAAIDDSYFDDEWYPDEYDDDDDDEWSNRYSYNSYGSSHRSIAKSIGINGSADHCASSWKDMFRTIASQALSVSCYYVDEEDQLHPYGNTLFPDDVDIIRVPRDIPQTWYTPIRPYTSRKPLPESLSQNILVQSVLKFNYSSLHQVFEGILINPPWDHITPKDLSNLSLPYSVIPTGIIFMWVEKKYISEVLTIMERKGFFYVENVNWVYKEPNDEFISYDSDTYLRKGKNTMILLRRGKYKNVGNSIELYPLQLKHQRTTDVYIGPKPQEKYKQYSNGYEFIYNLIETLLYEANYNEQTKQGKFLELWGQHGYTRKGWTIISEIQSNI